MFIVLLFATLCLSSEVLAQDVALKIPSQLEFCGERVPLENRDVKESLQKELLVTTYMHSRTYLTILNTTRYLPMITPILEKRGVPLDMVYLAMAESGLNQEVVSTAGAAGLWQIMSRTAKEKGFIVENDIDQRYHIEKATELACDYLLEAKRKLGSWTLAAASYNLGVAGVEKRMAKQRQKNYYDLYFPQETLRYVFRILSFKMVTQNPADYGFNIRSEEYYPPMTDYTTVEVSGLEIDWSEVAIKNGTTYKILRELNPWIRTYDYPNKGNRKMKIKIPGKDHRK